MSNANKTITVAVQSDRVIVRVVPIAAKRFRAMWTNNTGRAIHAVKAKKD